MNVFWLVILFLFSANLQAADDAFFGVPVHDPFRWLEEAKDPKVRQWVSEQDAQARKFLNKLPQRSRLLARYHELYSVEHLSTPVPAGDRLFFETHLKNKQKPVLVWRATGSTSEHPLVDVNRLPKEKNLSLSSFTPSWDGTKVLYITAENNADESVIHVVDVDTGRENPLDVIEGANYADPSWAADSHGFYYTRLPARGRLSDAQRVAQADVRFHPLESDPGRDRRICPPTGDPQIFLNARATSDGRWLFIIKQRGWTSNSVVFRPAESAFAAFSPLFISTSSMAEVAESKNRFFLMTSDHAPHERVVEARGPDSRDWRTIIPEQADTVLRSLRVIDNHLVVGTVSHAAEGIAVYSMDGRKEREISLPTLGTVPEIHGQEHSNALYFSFQSFMTPPVNYRVAVDSGKTELWSKEDLPVDPDRFQVKQVWYKSKDGATISMFIVESKRPVPNGSRAFLLHGYGGFNEAELPRFNPAIYPWLQAGGGYAVPNLRGGGEYGEAWHEAGMLLHKQKTFDDFIAAAEYLIGTGYTTRDRLAIDGTSNGGLLVAAALTQRPDLFRAAVCKVPLTDMIRYPLFGEGSSWIPEYGSPENEQEFRALYAYSPYHHVHVARYPAVLFLSADSDDRVDPMHARKMVAALQAANVSKEPILLLTEYQTGHQGAGRTQATIEEAADRTAFLMEEVGLQ